MTRPARQSGIALVTAILVVALAAIASAAILVSANIAIRRTANLQESELAWWYASGIESWTLSILERDLDDNQTDSFKDAWSKPVDYLPIDEGFVRGQIVDLQGRFNLNNLGTPDLEEFQKQQQIFVRLLAGAEAAEEFQARALAAAIRDWIDVDSEPTGFDGAEDAEYLSVSPPYRTANRLMSSVSELLAIKGVTRDMYQKLRELVAALPQYSTPINVNTAPAPVLFALAVQPSAQIEQFLREREDRPAETVQELFDPRAVFTAQDAEARMLSVSSSFFMLRAEVFVGSGRVALYSFHFRPRPGVPVVYGRSTDVE